MVEQIQRSEVDGAAVDPKRLTVALWKQRWVIAGVAVIGTVGGAALAKTVVKPVFEARSVIECDRCSTPRPEVGDRELATLQESVKLPQHLEKARQKLGLPATLETIDRNVEVSASIESRLIHVTARAESGELAAGLANVIVDEFIQTRTMVERDKLDDRLRTLMIDADNARLTVTEARGRYDRFRSENNIADLPAERLAAIEEAARLRRELALARGEEQGERARALALRRASSKEPATTLLRETEELPDAKRLAEAKGQLSAARARLHADHPRVQALTAEVEMLEKRLEGAGDAVTRERTVGRNPQYDLAQEGILKADANKEAASSRHSTYEKLAASAAQAAARLTSIEGQASELLSNLQYAERHSSTVELELKVAQDAARTPSTGLRILAMARAPLTPVTSIRRLVAILGPLMGSVIASIIILLREMRGLRIHTATELAFWGKGPVVAASHWPSVPEARDSLVADFIGPLRRSRGKTLLVGMSADESAYVDALATGIREHLDRDLAQQTIETSASHDAIPALRRVARNADRVIVMVMAGKHSGPAVRAFVDRLACPGQVAFVLLNLSEEHVTLPDVVGDGRAFWSVRRTHPKRNGKLGIVQSGANSAL